MEKLECKRMKPRKDNRNKVGIIFLIVGFILLGNNMHFIPNFVSGYLFSWPMFLIGLGLFMIIMNRRNVGGAIMIGIGGLFLWNKITPLSALQWEMAWPLVFIFVGFILIFCYLAKPVKEEKPIKPKKTAKPKSKYDDVEFDIDKIEPIES